MPIKDPTIYPPYWKQFSKWVRFERADGRCEQCGARNGYLKFTAVDKNWSSDPVTFVSPQDPERLDEVRDSYHVVVHTVTMVVLTVAHLDYEGGPCDCKARTGRKCARPDHVLALCQACHLAMDMPKHIANRQETLRTQKDAARPLLQEIG